MNMIGNDLSSRLAKRTVVRSDRIGVLDSVSPRFMPGATATKLIAEKSHANLSLDVQGQRIVAAAPIPAGTSQVATVREECGLFAVEYPITFVSE